MYSFGLRTSFVKINDTLLDDVDSSHISRLNNVYTLGLPTDNRDFQYSVKQANVSLSLINPTLSPSISSSRQAIQSALESAYLSEDSSNPLFSAGVFKAGVFKKIHLDNVPVLSQLPSSESFLFFRDLALSIAKQVSTLLLPFKILDHQIILYPSTALGRELHLDRHDGSRPNQNYRSLKLFFNLSDSYRIWGIGPSRINLIKQLNDYAVRHSLSPLTNTMFDGDYEPLPSWLLAYSNDKRLNHNISLLNSVLNNKYLSLCDTEGTYDHVFFPPYSYVLVDSKQVSHKPIYGEFGLSIDLIYSSPDFPLNI